MANLNLNTLALVSTLRPAPFNGAPSSDDYNDSQNETILDLVSISAFINNVLIPMLATLPDAALTGIEGTSIYGDTTDQTALFYDSVSGLPLSLSDGMRQLSAQISTGILTINNVAIQVGQLQQRLSSTNQNNIASTLQNLTNSINTLANQQISTDASIQEIANNQSTGLISSLLGPATAPTGSCSGSEGRWVFSQDGHATWGSPTTHQWVSKI